MDKPKLLTHEYADGDKTTVVWCPFWGNEPTRENFDGKVIETDTHIEFLSSDKINPSDRFK